MDAQVHTDPQLFWMLAGPHFLADPIRNTVAITVMQRCLADAEAGIDSAFAKPLMVTVHDNSGALRGAALRTAPWPVQVSGLPLAAVPAVVDALVLHAPELNFVAGPRAEAEAFARAWAERTGRRGWERTAMRTFRLGELRVPSVVGAARIGGPADLELLARWREAFNLADFGQSTVDERAGALAALEAGDPHFLWEVDGEPVSLAFTNLPSGGMSRVRYVYTPEEHRGHGYASAVTAAASAWALEQGARDVVLFTDLANPQTNRIYPRLGYQAVLDVTEIEFSAGAGDGAVADVTGEHQ